MISAGLLAILGMTSIKDCGNGLGRATNLTFDSQPPTPVVGDNITMWVGYTIDAPEITGGTTTYKVTLNGLPFPPTVKNLCEETTCPKKIGFNNESSWSVYTGGVSGKVVSQISWKDQNDALVWCVETTWKL